MTMTARTALLLAGLLVLLLYCDAFQPSGPHRSPGKGVVDPVLLNVSSKTRRQSWRPALFLEDPSGVNGDTKTNSDRSNRESSVEPAKKKMSLLIMEEKSAEEVVKTMTKAWRTTEVKKEVFSEEKQKPKDRNPIRDKIVDVVFGIWDFVTIFLGVAVTVGLLLNLSGYGYEWVNGRLVIDTIEHFRMSNVMDSIISTSKL